MQISADVSDVAAYRKRLDAAARRAKAKAGTAVKAIGQRMIAETKKNISSGPTRAVDTGFMLGSVDVITQTDMSVTVAVGADYGAHVNYGTWRMKPRPFWTNAERTVGDEFKTVAEVLAKDLFA